MVIIRACDLISHTSGCSVMSTRVRAWNSARQHPMLCDIYLHVLTEWTAVELRDFSPASVSLLPLNSPISGLPFPSCPLHPPYIMARTHGLCNRGDLNMLTLPLWSGSWFISEGLCNWEVCLLKPCSCFASGLLTVWSQGSILSTLSFHF